MRIRQVKPAFWSDARLSRQPERVRLFYIGLWMEADDSGWLRWDVAEVANDLYGYEGRGARERRVQAMFEALVSAGHVVLHQCGHANIPNLPTHQRLAGAAKQVHTALNEHRKVCLQPREPQVPAGARGSPPGKVRVPNGTERVSSTRNGDGKRARGRTANGAGATRHEEGTVSEFQLRVPRPA